MAAGVFQNLTGIQADAMTIWIGFLTILCLISGSDIIIEILSNSLEHRQNGRILDEQYRGYVQNRNDDRVSRSSEKSSEGEDYSSSSHLSDKEWEKSNGKFW